MARTELTVIDLPGALDIDGTVLTWTAADQTNKNFAVITGREILLIRNDNVGVQTVTVHSAPDHLSREGDLVFTDIAASAYAIGGPFPVYGWANAGQLDIDAAAADVMLCVVRLPSSWAGK
jgi:hypothetical protein